MNAAFTALRDKGIDFTISDILLGANVSTCTFYRHFESKDSLLAAMYLDDAQKAADRLVLRLSATASSLEAVTAWVDEIFSFLRSGRRAERVMVLGSIIGYTSSAFGNAVTVGRDLLIAPLREAINSSRTTRPEGNFGLWSARSGQYSLKMQQSILGPSLAIH